MHQLLSQQGLLEERSRCMRSAVALWDHAGSGGEEASLAAGCALARGAAMRERFQLMLRLRRPYERFLAPNEIVLLAGVVKRLDVGLFGLGWGAKGRHQLVLTSHARLLCLEQVTLAWLGVADRTRLAGSEPTQRDLS